MYQHLEESCIGLAESNISSERLCRNERHTGFPREEIFKEKCSAVTSLHHSDLSSKFSFLCDIDH
jgi:hypothetical protein